MTTQYKILTGSFDQTDPVTHLESFSKLVEEFMNAGWLPMGGPVVEGNIVFQAVATDIYLNPASFFKAVK
jgi:hypothetical protein